MAGFCGNTEYVKVVTTLLGVVSCFVCGLVQVCMLTVTGYDYTIWTCKDATI